MEISRKDAFEMAMSADVLLINSHSGIMVGGGSAAEESLQEALEAEELLMKANTCPQLKEKYDLSGVHKQIIECLFYLLLGGKEESAQTILSNRNEIIRRYHLITGPKFSKTEAMYLITRSYINPTADLPAQADALLASHDSTLDDSMALLLCFRMSRMYMVGEGVEADYDRAYYYAKHVKQLDTDHDLDDLAELFESGEAKKQFDELHPPKQLSIMDCHIAPAVYGFSDCPQVWTLHRFRDNILVNRLWGRIVLFLLHVIYVVSLSISRRLDREEQINAFWRRKLDGWVKQLNDCGVKDTPIG